MRLHERLQEYIDEREVRTKEWSGWTGRCLVRDRPEEYFVKAIQEYPFDERDDKDFQKILEFAVDEVGVGMCEMGDRLNVGVGRIRSWRKGQQIPYPVVRSMVYRYLEKNIEG